jgi:NAD(P)-dependent dehydrogenase (short-subunit alcohol dehydrogenase family)
VRLKGKVALVSGAARGIGLAIAQAFAAEGAAHVLLTDIDAHTGEANTAPLAKAASFALLDVREEAAWQACTNSLMQRFGRLDIVVNNAGITGFESGPALHDPEFATLLDWRDVHRTNLDGTFLGCKYAIQAMRRAGNGGSIINISSRSGLVGIPGAAAYASSKAAIRNHTKTVALYCAEQRLDIRCNAIFPAAIMTPMWEPMFAGLQGAAREARMADFVAETPLRRFGQPTEVAALAVMLASDEARYVTGAEFVIDGGLLAGSAAVLRRGAEGKEESASF